MTKNISILVLLFCCLTFFISINCAKQEKTNGTTVQTPVTSSSNVAEVTAVMLKPNLAPNFTWKDASGKQVDFESFRGKVTLLNFWATWCGPCKRELPDLIALSKELADKNIKIIGVSVDRSSDVLNSVKSFSDEHGIPYQIVIANDELVQAFGNVYAIPTSFVIDQQGKIAQTLVGMRSKEAIAQALTSTLQ